MIRVGFIQPTSDYLYDPFRVDPFTQLAILTVLENAFGNRLELLLIDLRGVKKEFSLFHIPECNIYLHSVCTLDYDEQVTLVSALRKFYPKAVHIAGGPHVAEFKEECGKIFDCLIIGEGEEIIIDAMRDYINGKIKKMYLQKEVIDINKYQFMNRRYLPFGSTARKNVMTLKNRPGTENIIGTTVIFSRGCPFSCYFCDIRKYIRETPKLRFRKPELVADEIGYLKKNYHIQGINIVDEIGFPLKKEEAIKHLEAIGNSNIIWRGQCRADGMTFDLAKLARQTGCVAMGLGIESIWQLSLNLINKKINLENIRRTISIFKENEIEVRLYLIIGLPGEPEDIVEKTWSFFEEAKPDLVHLSLLTIRPGTEMFRHPEKFGIEWVSTDWSKTMHMHGRFSEERIDPTFRYSKYTPWGKSMSHEMIIKNYLELQNRLKEHGMASLPSAPYW